MLKFNKMWLIKILPPCLVDMVALQAYHEDLHKLAVVLPSPKFDGDREHLSSYFYRVKSFELFFYVWK